MPAGDFGASDDVLGISAVDAGQKWNVELVLDFPTIVELRGAPCGLAHEIDREIGDDAIEPGEKARAAVKRVETAINAEECFLDDFPGVIFVAHQTERDGERSPLVPLHQLSERRSIAGFCTFDEGTVFFGFRLSR